MVHNSRTRSGTPSRIVTGVHPLLDSSPASSFAHVPSPVVPECVPVETVDPNESDEEDGNLTDQDAGLSDGSSLGDASAFGPPDITKLMEMGNGLCRAPTQVSSTDGAKVPCVCGKTIEECQRHATHRINGRYRYPIGFYLPMDTASRGFQGNGRVGTFYTSDQYRKLADEDFEEMERVADGMQDGMQDDDDEIEELGGAPQVTFGPATATAKTRDVPYSPPAERLRATLSDLTRQGQAETKRPNPNLWYGLLDVSGARWLFQDLPKAQAYVDMGKIFRFSRVFETRAEAYAWKEAEGIAEKATISIADSNSSPDDGSSSGDSSEPKRRQSRKDRKKKKKKKPSKSSKNTTGKGRSRHRAPSQPSSSSSSDSSDSDSNSTDSSSNEARHRRHGRKKKASRKAKRKSKGQQEEKKFFGNDPSVGNRKRVHDLPINGKEIDKAAGPPDMRSKDSAELWNAAVDVTALPGMFINIGSGGGDNIDDEAQRTTEMAATLIATVIGKRAQIHDSLWKTQKRHSLGQVKSREGLFKFVKSVAKSEESAFEQQENALQVFMLPRHYDETAICEYVQNGFLPRLTAATFRCYSNLLSTVRQLAFDHAAFWDKGPAKAMLDFHSGRLLTIRQNSLTRKALILQTYTYLRDANSKGFYHESMTESLWDRLSDLSSVTGGRNGGNNGGGNGDTNGGGGGISGGGDASKNPKCSHCRNPRMHELMQVRPSKQVCPLKDLSPKRAREVSRNAVECWNRESCPDGFPSVLEVAKNFGVE
jgi:hypothetical protein